MISQGKQVEQQKTTIQQTDLLSLPANPDEKAADYIVADQHGNADLFDVLLNKYQLPGDRIFIAGDIIDRGPGSVNIIRAMVENSKDPGKRKIYCVRGNHEDMCGDSIDALTSLASIHLFGHPNTGEYSRDIYLLNLYVLSQYWADDPEMEAILKNSVFKYFLDSALEIGKTIFDERMSKFENHASMTMDEKVVCLKEHTRMIDGLEKIHGNFSSIYAAISCHQDENNGGQWLINLFLKECNDSTIFAAANGMVGFADHSDVAMIRDYLRSLPYIIRVDGKIPFFIVHADMPISEAVFFQLLASGEGLSPSQKDYAMWARARDADIKIVKIKGRDKYSVLAITGHTIDGGVRMNMNTVDTDVMAYVRNCAIVIKMPACEVEMLTKDKDVEVDATVLRIALQVQRQLNKQPALAAIRVKQERVRARVAKMSQSPGLFQEAPQNDGEVKPKSVATPPNSERLIKKP